MPLQSYRSAKIHAKFSLVICDRTELMYVMIYYL